MTEARVRQIIAAVRRHGVPLPPPRVVGFGYTPAPGRLISCAPPGVGDFTLPVLVWPQIGVSLIVGLGLGYVLFAKK